MIHTALTVGTGTVPNGNDGRARPHGRTPAPCVKTNHHRPQVRAMGGTITSSPLPDVDFHSITYSRPSRHSKPDSPHPCVPLYTGRGVTLRLDCQASDTMKCFLAAIRLTSPKGGIQPRHHATHPPWTPNPCLGTSVVPSATPHLEEGTILPTFANSNG